MVFCAKQVASRTTSCKKKAIRMCEQRKIKWKKEWRMRIPLQSHHRYSTKLIAKAWLGLVSLGAEGRGD
jgi:hypothetical protein